MSSHNHYSRFLASVYDTVLLLPIRKIRKSVRDVLIHTGAESVIDLCCGTGNQILYLQKAGIKNLVGVDMSENMLQQAWRKGLKDICLQKDASQTGFEDDAYDAAIMSFCLHETQAYTAEGIFSEARRIVRPGGLLIVVDYSFDQHTQPLGRFAARAVEKMVGGEHYQNFKHFMAHDLLSEFSKDLKLQHRHRFLLGAAAIWVFLND